MAKGTITFEFESLPDLQRQMWAMLGPMNLMADAARTLPTGTVYYSDGGEPTHIPTTQATPFCVDPDTTEPAPNMAPRGVPGIFLGEGMSAASLVGKSPMAGKTAIMDEVRKRNAEAAKEEVKTDTAPTTTAETAPTPAPEKPVEATSTAPVPGAVTETLTVEDIPKAEYKDLLAFCKSNPGVGLDVSKCQHEYFRKFVEMKVKTYLETK